jgi:hypothetical protein
MISQISENSATTLDDFILGLNILDYLDDFDLENGC